MKLSQNFYLAEFTHSQAAARLGRELVVPPELLPNLKRLCSTVLEPLRTAWLLPVQISSGYRDAVVNAAVGGAATSAHCEGRAADISVPGETPYSVAMLLHKLQLTEVDKCILEFDAWVHVQIAKPGQTPRRQYLTARKIGGKVYYFDRLLRRGEQP